MEGNIQVLQSESLLAINKSEIDMQIATAHQYPRDINRVLNQIKTYATIDEATAADCFYALPRAGSTIEGISVRFAEILAGAWGNLRVQSRIIGNDGKVITAQAICHDLESNLAISVEVKRKITDRQGRTFSEDMQVTTGNAACSIAFRNAVLKTIPKAITSKLLEDIKQVGLGKAMDLTTRRNNMIAMFNKAGITTPDILEYLNASCVEDIDANMIFTMGGLWNAVKEGTTTLEDTIKKELKEKREAAQAEKKAKTAKEKVDAAMNG